ncbi:RING-type domain-containing protein [Psidium guajava]|nr:RING-type domain-containing protein [Psidium guajava]
MWAGRQPEKILNYPQNGRLTYLFRKILTTFDLEWGLVLTLSSIDYLETITHQTPLLDFAPGDGVTVQCYTPAMHHGVVLTNHVRNPRFRFKKSGWDQVAAANGLVAGQEIHCWALYDANDGPHGTLSFLIEPVGDPEVPEEAAPGGAEA